jgi:predicted AAA+ superfamily ATPase
LRELGYFAVKDLFDGEIWYLAADQCAFNCRTGRALRAGFCSVSPGKKAVGGRPTGLVLVQYAFIFSDEADSAFLRFQIKGLFVKKQSLDNLLLVSLTGAKLSRKWSKNNSFFDLNMAKTVAFFDQNMYVNRMKRHSEQVLERWYSRSSRKPLVLRGARQVGKSTLVRQFCAGRKLDLIEVNLEKRKLHSLSKVRVDTRGLLQEIEVISKRRVGVNSLIFFDEIQEQPEILAALRYFYEDHPELAIIAAGSLLEFVMNESDFSMPVGRIEYHFLGPMLFTEFLMALEEDILLDALRSKPKSIPTVVHERLAALFKEYLFVGGMPEAVLTYVQSKSPVEVRRIQLAIMQTYYDDFGKYASAAEVARIRKIFDFVPGHLGEKIKFSEIDREQKARDLKAALGILERAGIVRKVFHTNASGLPLKSQMDDSVFKLFFLDVGLANALLGVEWNSVVYSSEKQLLNKGPMAEQFVSQHLSFRNQGEQAPDLFYWLRDKKAQNAEIDFVISKDLQILPIEVKAEKNGKLKSLNVFMSEKQLPIAIKMDLSPYRSELIEARTAQSQSCIVFELITLPIYAVEKIFDFIV